MLTRVRSGVGRVFDSTRTFGIRRGAHDAAIRAANRALYFRVLKGLVITEPGKSPDTLSYRHGFAEPEHLGELAGDPAYEMSLSFLTQALGKGDECYAIWDGDVLASYGWYSTAPTRMQDDLVIRFDDRFAYMYKGFTHPRYRGQRLYASGVCRALESYLKRGRVGLVSYVESNNFRSLKSCYRMGYRDFGWIAMARALGRYHIRCSRGCRDYGFTLGEQL